VSIIARGLAVVAVWAAVAGCMPVAGRPGTAPVPTPVENADRPFVFAGFSVLPPRGASWVVLPLEAGDYNHVVMFGKRVRDTPPSTPAEERTVIAVAKLWDLRDDGPRTAEGLQRWSERSGAKAGERFSPRHHALGLTAVVEPGRGAECVRYALAVEDDGVPGFPGSVFVLSARGIRCLHPRWPRYAVDLSYSERHLRGQPPLALDAEAEPFMRSLHFTPERPFAASIIPIGVDLSGVAAGAGSAGVAQMTGDTVRRIDLRTNEAVGEPIAVGHQPAGMAFGRGALWVTNRGANTVSRIDPAAGKVVATIPVGADPRVVAAGTTGVWVANFGGETVTRIDPPSNGVLATVRVGRPTAIAEGAGAIWVALSHENSLVRIDPATHRIAARIPLGAQGFGVAVLDDMVWVAGGESSTAFVARVDPQLNTVSERMSVGGTPAGDAVSPGAVWVSNFPHGSVFKLDPRASPLAGQSLAVGKGALWITTGEGAIWIGNRRRGTVARIDLP